MWCKRECKVIVVAAALVALMPAVTLGVGWPFAPQDDEHTVSNAYGDHENFSAPDTHYYHNGIDIPKAAGTDVLAPATGWVYDLYDLDDGAPASGQAIYIRQEKNAPNVGWEVVYWHVDFSDGLPPWRIEQIEVYGNPQGVTLGYHVCEVYHEANWAPPCTDHVHYCHYYNGVEVNPIDHLSPTVDTSDPWAGGLRFRTNASARGNTYFATSEPKLWGNIDAVVNGYDEFVGSWNLNVYRLHFKVLRRIVNCGHGNLAWVVVHDFDTGNYPLVANTSFAHYEDSGTCPSPGSWTSSGAFWWIVTNKNNNDDYDAADEDYYWDTDARTGDEWNDRSLLANGSEDPAHEAPVPWYGVALFPDGQYRVDVSLTDQAGNDTDVDDSTQNVIVDNFRPFVRQLDVSDPYHIQGAGRVYLGEWQLQANDWLAIVPNTVDTRITRWVTGTVDPWVTFSEAIPRQEGKHTIQLETATEGTFGPSQPISLYILLGCHDLGHGQFPLSTIQTHEYDGWHRQVRMWGEDVAGNTILGINQTHDPQFDPRACVKRDGAGNIPGGAGYDMIVHKIVSVRSSASSQVDVGMR